MRRCQGALGQLGRSLACLAAAVLLSQPAYASPLPQVSPPTSDLDLGNVCYAHNLFPVARYGTIVLNIPNSVGFTLGPFGAAEALADYATDDTLRQKAGPVGRLDVVMSNGCMQTCTATLLPEGHIVTAAHCFFGLDQSHWVRAQIVFDHYSSLDTSLRPIAVRAGTVKVFADVANDQGTELHTDVAIARLESVPDRPAALLFSNLPGPGTSLELIHHPRGQPKHITRASCRVTGTDGVLIQHRCDTVGGSSGAPMIDQATGRIIGIHTDGGLNTSAGTSNRGYAIGAVASQIREAFGEKLFATADAALPETIVTSELSEVPTAAASAAVLRGVEAYNRGAFLDALMDLRPAALAGDPVAQTYLGDMLLKGQGIARDEGEAFRQYRLAAASGEAEAMLRLGNAYFGGLGTPQNYAEALQWYLRAADQGNASAQHNIGQMYNRGSGVEANQPMAWQWFRRAADQGHVPSMNALGFLLSFEDDTALRSEGADWRLRAAELGDMRAKAVVGGFLLRGDGEHPRDVDRGLAWLGEAAAAGEGFASRELGKAYLKGEGPSQDLQRGENYLRDAVRQGDNWAALYLGEHLTSSGRAAEGLTFIELAAQGGDDAVRFLAWRHLALHHYRLGGVSNLQTALKWAVLAIDGLLFEDEAARAPWVEVIREARARLSADDQTDALREVCAVRNVILVDCEQTPPRWSL